MKKVITLIGLDRGKEVYMHPHEADAAVSTGVACWPDQWDGGTGETEKAPDALRIEKGSFGPILVGPWPESATITQGNRNLGVAKVFRSGTIEVKIGDRKAIYQSYGNVGSSGDLMAKLREVLDEPQDGDEDEVEADVADNTSDPVAQNEAADQDEAAEDRTLVEIPEVWRGLHWKRRTAIASLLSGEDVTDADVANEIIADEVVRRALVQE